MKLKIARIITRMDVGGAQRVVLYLSRDLDPTLFEQIVITGKEAFFCRNCARSPRSDISSSPS
jgi:hypothetical protein